MARIRSTHPGQWTAGDFLECSPLARLLALALRNVADDHGIFRWKPKTIKAECLPADNCEIDSLLGELVANRQVQKYAIQGKDYGIILDFTQWQRPKKPKYLHPVPPEFSTSTEPVPNEEETGSEIPPQRKEEGGIDSEVVTHARAPAKSLISEEAFKVAGDLLQAMGLEREHPLSVGAPMTVQSWLNGGWPAEIIKLGVEKAMQNRKQDPPGTLKYFEKAIARAHAEMTRPLPIVEFKQAETLTVTHGTTSSKPGSLIAAIDRKIAAIEAEDRADFALSENPVLRISG